MIETANTLILDAYGLLGIPGEGASLTADETSLAIRVLNRMIGNWNIKDLLVYAVTATTFPFVANKKTYMLGSGGDFDFPRPSRIERMSVVYPNPTMNPASTVEIPVTFLNLQEWQNVAVKNVQGTLFPSLCYNDDSYPFMTLNFWPAPGATCSCILYTWDMLPEIVNLTDVISLPPGYTQALLTNLAVKLAPYFSITPSDQIVSDALESKHDIDGINSGALGIVNDPMYCPRGDGSRSLALRSMGWVVD